MVTPSMLRRLSMEIGDLKRKRRTRHVDDLRVASIDVVKVKQDGPYYYVTVAIEATGRDFTVNDKNGQVIAGKRAETELERRLVFLRSEKVKTRGGGDEPIAIKCPSCGAPIEITAAGRCNYCDQEITTGEFSWVMSEMAETRGVGP